ncbi:hypothetical protein LTR78_008085 [Recurvomyces mirabilis]|uniref:Zn(2)-C6 fungal-type domain-containing protein n=1 Tax=Recurvomyces mirabilis TaxID=574656 RepID=A0AAE0TQV0_9PEZI|nr:hypothetical protein LTR78_008085 [Recurvomyces mirabilis]KAK5150812.1 hypothetical protein LTS14_009876 [Recurvomyces mirabilis]
MSATSQNQSCTACAQSKRKCNKQRPSCRRCRDRDEDCVYRPRKKHCRQRRPLTNAFEAEQHIIGDDLIVTPPHDWPALSFPDPALDFTTAGWSIPPSPRADGGIVTQSLLPITAILPTIPPDQSLWFLQTDSWTLHQNDELASCQSTTDLEAVFDTVRSMLVRWIETGSNGFIHSKLYEYGMPTSLQDAFVIFASYTAATPAMRTTVLQIADERARRLIQERVSTADEGLGEVRAQLSRVHALFVLVFIRLFDGSVRFRASAEKQVHILRKWMNDSRMVATGHRGYHALAMELTGVDRRSATTSIWHSWLEIESVRRTLLIVQTIANVYHCMTVGHATCHGAVMITARKGMFEAQTSAKWLDICSSIEEPLLVPPLRPTAWMLEHSSADVDEFVLEYWRYIVEPDRLKCWVDRGRRDHTVDE